MLPGCYLYYAMFVPSSEFCLLLLSSLRITIRGAPRYSELSPVRHPNVIGGQFSCLAGIAPLCQYLPRAPLADWPPAQAGFFVQIQNRDGVKKEAVSRAGGLKVRTERLIAGVTGTVCSSEARLLI